MDTGGVALTAQSIKYLFAKSWELRLYVVKWKYGIPSCMEELSGTILKYVPASSREIIDVSPAPQVDWGSSGEFPARFTIYGPIAMIAISVRLYQAVISLLKALGFGFETILVPIISKKNINPIVGSRAKIIMLDAYGRTRDASVGGKKGTEIRMPKTDTITSPDNTLSDDLFLSQR